MIATQPIATFSIATFDEEIARPAKPGTANIVLYPAIDADAKAKPTDQITSQDCP